MASTKKVTTSGPASVSVRQGTYSGGSTSSGSSTSTGSSTNSVKAAQVLAHTITAAHGSRAPFKALRQEINSALRDTAQAFKDRFSHFADHQSAMATYNAQHGQTRPVGGAEQPKTRPSPAPGSDMPRSMHD